MKRSAIIIFLASFICLCNESIAQQKLPAITAKNLNGKIVLSWLNLYKRPISNILIQRSYDSLRNFSTIGTVLNPLNTENGFPDINPPYDKMYYRLNIIFEGGQYEIGPSTRPTKEGLALEELNITYIPENTPLTIEKDSSKFFKEIQQVSIEEIKPTKQKNSQPKIITKEKPNKVDSMMAMPPKRIIETAYPSNRIFTSRFNTVVIQLPAASTKNYSLKIFDESEKLSIELKKITEDYLILEKVNFLRSGWYRFELYENGEIYEKNKFFIGKDKAK